MLPLTVDRFPTIALKCAKPRLSPDGHWLVNGSFLLTESFCKKYLFNVTSLWCILVKSCAQWCTQRMFWCTLECIEHTGGRTLSYTSGLLTARISHWTMWFFPGAWSSQINNFVYCIHSYRMRCLKIYLYQTLQMGFVFVLKMFQDKCNRHLNRD